jgi:hypothetical protein
MSMQRRIVSLSIEYDAHGEYFSRERQWRPTNSVLRLVVAKDHRRHIWNRHLAGGGLLRDDSSESLSYYDGRHWNVYFPYDRLFEVSAAHSWDPSRLKAIADPIVESLGWWPASDKSVQPKLGGKSFFLVEMLRSMPFQIGEEQECVDGRWCNVLDFNGIDRWWVDCERSVLIQRVRCEGVSMRPSIAYRLSGYCEYDEDVWLPHHITRACYSAFTLQPSLASEFTVRHYQVNSVSEDVLRFEPPSSALVYNRDTAESYCVPDRDNYIEIVVDRARVCCEASMRRSRAGRIGGLDELRNAGLGAALGLLMCVGGMAVRTHGIKRHWWHSERKLL